MSDVVRMRTLTWKSNYGFGYEDTKDLTMLQLYDLGKVYQMVNAYYFLAKINYIDDILDAIGITKELRIDKPYSFRGSEEEGKKGGKLVKKALDNYYSQFTEKQIMGIGMKNKKTKAISSKKLLRKTDGLTSKTKNRVRNNKYK